MRKTPSFQSFPFSNVSISKNLKVSVNDEGMYDYQEYPERIYISDLHENMKGVSLLGRILLMHPNIPVSISSNENDSKHKMIDEMARFPLRLMDETGSVDITLWGNFGKRFSKNRPGQYIYLSGIRTTKKKQNGSFFVNCSLEYQSNFICISTLPGILTSPHIICEKIPLSVVTDSIGNRLDHQPTHDFRLNVNVNSSENFICHAAIVSIEFPFSNPLYLVHKVCQRPVDKITNMNVLDSSIDIAKKENALDLGCSSVYFCPFCAEMITEEFIENSLSLRYTLDDGTRQIIAFATLQAHKDILQMCISELKKLDDDCLS